MRARKKRPSTVRMAMQAGNDVARLATFEAELGSAILAELDRNGVANFRLDPQGKLRLEVSVEPDPMGGVLPLQILDKAVEVTENPFAISVYVRGMPGFFRYRVKTRDQAMDHFGAITSGGYRRPNDRGIFEWYAPSLIERIRIDGPGLESQYHDEFVRT